MKFLVFSDLHGGDLNRVINKNLGVNGVDGVIFLGDGGGAIIDRLREKFKTVYAVRGNCDGFIDLPIEEEITVGIRKLLICHGHKYMVKSTKGIILAEAQRRGCDAVLFGHTHIPCCEYEEGIYLLNPGSSSGYKPTCGLLDVSSAGIMFSVVEI